MRWILFAAALISTPAFASDWKIVSSGPKNGDVYIDVASATRNGNKITVWEKWDQTIKKSKETKNGKLVSEIKTRSTYDCSDQTVDILQSVYYDSDGNVIYTYTKPLFVQPTLIVPDTIGDGIARYVCELK